MVDGNAVYISFNRCEDTIRHSFLSHISAEFRSRGISCEDPVSDNDWVPEERDDAALAKSKVSLVILSEKYVLSKRCLDELLNAFESRFTNNLVFVPVFYGLTKSVLKKQCLALKKMYPDDRVADWRRALMRIADLPGHASSLDRSEAEFVEQIVAGVRQKLDLTAKIGIYSRLMKIENLLCKQPWGVRSLGIWGMGGIGKSTLAEAAFEQLSGDFEAACFIKDFDRDYQKKGAYELLKEHLGEKLRLNNNPITRKKLRNKRIMIVLDDVYMPVGATAFLAWFDLLDPRSLIIITSRDKKLLLQLRVKDIYEVQGLDKHEALQAFSTCVPELVDYADGNPLALSLYCKELEGKKPSAMESEVRKLKRELPSEMFNTLKKSYDTLSDSEKEMFLGIVYFLRGENIENVMQLLAGYGLFPHVGIDVLVNKSLVVISENRVQIHNLIYDVGLKIICDQREETEMGYKFLNASNIQSLQEGNASEEIEEPKPTPKQEMKAITLDAPNLAFTDHVEFLHMYNLRYMKIHSVNLMNNHDFRLPEDPQSLDLPPELRILHWKYYPLQSFPQDFDVQHLVELNMPDSKLQKLWKGTKNLVMLKRVTLSQSQQLENVDELKYCPNIEKIDLRGCSKLRSFPDMRQSHRLRVVNLSSCIEIESFPEVPPSESEGLPSQVSSSTQERSDMVIFAGRSELKEIKGLPQNLEELYLAKTAIRKIPASLCHHLAELVTLDMENCILLRDLPMGMSDMKTLVTLKLSGCSILENIQDLPTNLKELYLADTAVKNIPSSLLENLSKLVILSLANCKRLQHLPMEMSNLNSLVTLKLSGCSKLEVIKDLPRNLKEIYLAGTALRKLPSSIVSLAELATLDLKDCKRLQQLPPEMQNLNPLEFLDLSDCSELKVIGISSLPQAKERRLDRMGMSLPATENEAGNASDRTHEVTQARISRRSLIHRLFKSLKSQFEISRYNIFERNRRTW